MLKIAIAAACCVLVLFGQMWAGQTTRIDPGEHFYRKEKPDAGEHASQLAQQVKRIADAHRRYRTTIKEIAGKNLRLALDEWNFGMAVTSTESWAFAIV